MSTATRIVHERQLALSEAGDRLDGVDSFVTPSGNPVSRSGKDLFAIRFHLHPNVRASRSPDGRARARSSCPTARRWEFETDGPEPAIEESILMSNTRGNREDRADRHPRPRPGDAERFLADAPHRRRRPPPRTRPGPAPGREAPDQARRLRRICRPAESWLSARCLALPIRSHEWLSRRPDSRRPITFPLRRALLSVYDKTGLVDFATALAERGVETRLDRRHARRARRRRPSRPRRVRA